MGLRMSKKIITFAAAKVFNAPNKKTKDRQTPHEGRRENRSNRRESTQPQKYQREHSAQTIDCHHRTKRERQEFARV